MRSATLPVDRLSTDAVALVMRRTGLASGIPLLLNGASYGRSSGVVGSDEEGVVIVPSCRVGALVYESVEMEGTLLSATGKV